MSRRMSVSMTMQAVYERRKTVTRRNARTWQGLFPGDRLTLIEKGMGLPPGARQVVITEVEIVDIRVEPIGWITAEECAREGFPDMTPAEFVEFWLRGHGHRPDAVTTQCRRIEWRYLDLTPQGPECKI